MGAAAIELRNCVVRKDYTVSYAAMTVYDGMTLSSFPVVEPMVLGVWYVCLAIKILIAKHLPNTYYHRFNFKVHKNPIRAARLYTEKPHDALVLVRSATRRDSGAQTGPGRPQAASRPCEAPRAPRFFFRVRSEKTRDTAMTWHPCFLTLPPPLHGLRSLGAPPRL